MRELILVTLLFMLFIGCSAVDEPEPYLYIDDDLQQHVDDFFVEGSKRGRGDLELPLSFQLEFNVYIKGAGLTRTFPSGKVEVFISSKYFTWSRSDREYVVFHELAHAILKRSHNKDNNSIMCADLYPSLEYYRANREEMLDELYQ